MQTRPGGRARRGVAVGLLGPAVCLAAVAVSAEGPFQQGRIPHRDGSGHATIVEVQPGVPGGKELIRSDDDRPAPKRLIVRFARGDATDAEIFDLVGRTIADVKVGGGRRDNPAADSIAVITEGPRE